MDVTPPPQDGDVEPISLTFAAAARVLGREAASRRLLVPAFRSPPRAPEVTRSIRRSGRSVTISVAARGRPWVSVLGDMVDGVIAANELTGADERALRSALWDALAADPRVHSALLAA